MGRWFLWVAAVAAVVLVAFFPLRLALDAADLPKLGLNARQVSGTIWDGRISDLTLDRQALGSFDVMLKPGPLLLGSGAMRFERVQDLQGPLTGTLLSGRSAHGVEGLSGRLATGNLFAPMPVEALEFSRVTVVFRNRMCVEARGQVTAVVGTRIGGLDLTQGLSGPVTCEGERVRARLASGGGREQVEFFLADDGRYRAFMTVRGVAPEVGMALSLLGFRGGPGGLTMTMSGKL